MRTKTRQISETSPLVMSAREKLRKRNKYFPIQIFGDVVQNRLDALKEYLSVVDSMFEQELKRFNNWYDKETSNMNDEEQEFFAGFYAEDYWRLQRDLPKIHLSSFLVTVCSNMESELVWLCEYFERQNKITCSYKDQKKGNIIQKVRRYLYSSVGLKLGKNEAWDDLACIYNIRNCIVHADSVLNPDLKKNRVTKAFIERTNSINLNEKSEINLESGFLEMTIRLFETVNKDICNAWRELVEAREQNA